MGKASTLKSNSKDTGTRYAHANGDRKLFDVDACPSGCDENIWHLALFYRDCATDHGFQCEAPPILNEVIRSRVLTDSQLRGIVDSDGRALVTLAEEMIELFFDSYSSNSLPYVSTFTSSFSDLKAVVISRHDNSILLSSGSRTVNSLPEAKPDRRTEWEKERARIISATVDEETARRKIEGFIKTAAV